VQRKGFTLLELLIVISIIIVLFSILLTSLITAKDSALELCAMQVAPDKDGKVLLEIRNLSYRKSYEGIYMIKIDSPRNCSVSLKKPYHPGMKLIDKDGEDYIKWRPRVRDIGVHPVTVVFNGEKISEQQMTVYVYNKKLLDAQRENKPGTD
jgi:prepilin-type N-terminal cleavage/methylation domain-containing protein